MKSLRGKCHNVLESDSFTVNRTVRELILIPIQLTSLSVELLLPNEDLAYRVAGVKISVKYQNGLNGPSVKMSALFE